MLASEEKGVELLHSVLGESEADEEALGAVLAHDDGSEPVDVRVAALSFCFTCGGCQRSMKSSSPVHRAAFLWHPEPRVDAAVDAHVAALALVGDAALSDDPSSRSGSEHPQDTNYRN